MYKDKDDKNALQLCVRIKYENKNKNDTNMYKM